MNRYNLCWAIKGFKLALDSGWSAGLPEGAARTRLALRNCVRPRSKMPRLVVRLPMSEKSSPARAKNNPI